MHQILVWQLSLKINLVFSSLKADLGSITCCDFLTLSLDDGLKKITLTSDFAGCEVEKLQKSLQIFLQKEQKSIHFLNLISLSKDRFDQVLVRCGTLQDPACYQVIDLEIVSGWSTQLELLHVLMEENDLEKKSRGKGCC